MHAAWAVGSIPRNREPRTCARLSGTSPVHKKNRHHTLVQQFTPASLIGGATVTPRECIANLCIRCAFLAPSLSIRCRYVKPIHPAEKRAMGIPGMCLLCHSSRGEAVAVSPERSEILFQGTKTLLPTQQIYFDFDCQAVQLGVSRRGKKLLNSLRDKNEGMLRKTGEGGECPLCDPVPDVRLGGSKRTRANTTTGTRDGKKKRKRKKKNRDMAKLEH